METAQMRAAKLSRSQLCIRDICLYIRYLREKNRYCIILIEFARVKKKFILICDNMDNVQEEYS